ncbi:hypothetical protein NQ315_002423 [Exocentrus adspersus]|uniref:Uncharacterized protein n=1 Tax=Exocentrus adspersus TaxID=1586481 RepID=A0AAV8VTN7_9CUCU|nr:hypothetical protein NQ315_002423 [Exocentrus adspersus]
MGRKCAVPHCYTGYRKCKEKASLYRVPDDDFFLNKWQEAIARGDRPITPKDYVCEKHFKEDDILRRRIIKDVVEEYQRPRLKPDAIPSIFPELPEFVLKMVKKRRKTEDPKSTQTSEVSKITENETRNRVNIDEDIKIEPTESNTTINNNACDTISNNELDIKSEPEEKPDHSSGEEDVDNELDDPNFGPKLHQCSHCDYQTRYPHNLRTHQAKHLTGDQAYIHCEHCPNFKTKWELTYRNHLKIKHGIGKQETFKCTSCPFETRVRLCLRRHSERHQRGKPPRCNFPGCDFTSEDQGALAVHKMSHDFEDKETASEKSKNFKCTECYYETNSKTHIIKHIKTAHNSGDDTVVAVNLVNKNNTVVLPRAGTVTKALFRCIKCSYKSNSQASLLKHVSKHKDPDADNVPRSKVWKCPKCPFATFFQHALHTHQEAECGKVLACNECNFKSSHRSEFVKHSLTHRNVSVEPVNGEQVERVGTRSDKTEEHSETNAVPELVVVKSEVTDSVIA